METQGYAMKASLTLIVLFTVAINLSASTLLTFDDDAELSALFPLASRSSVGGNSSVLLNGTGSLHMRAQQLSGDGATSARMSIYSVASSDYDFLTSSKTFIFTDVAGAFYSSGATYSGNMGVFSGNSGSMTAPSTGPNDGLYFSVDRYTARVVLYQKYNTSTTLLTSWAVTSYSFSSLSFTLNGAEWSAVVVMSDGTNLGTSSGTFSNAINSSNWGSNFYLGIEANQTADNAARYTDLYMGGIAITAVPEPAVMAMLGMALVAAAFFPKFRAGLSISSYLRG